jgi:hypothetical protein
VHRVGSETNDKKRKSNAETIAKKLEIMREVDKVKTKTNSASLCSSTLNTIHIPEASVCQVAVVSSCCSLQTSYSMITVI